MDATQLTVKGMFVKANLEALMKRATPQQRLELEKKFGDIKIIPFKDYPIDFQNSIERFGTKLIFGSNTDEAYKELGKVSFTTFADSLIGKTMFSLLGNDPKKLAFGMNRSWKTVTSGIDIETYDLGEKKVSVRMKNNPYPPAGIESIYETGLHYMGYEGTVETVHHGGNDYEYIMSWK